MQIVKGVLYVEGGDVEEDKDEDKNAGGEVEVDGVEDDEGTEGEDEDVENGNVAWGEEKNVEDGNVADSEVRVTRFYKSCSSPAPDRSGHCRTSSASSRSQWALPDPNRELQIAVGTAGLHVPTPDLSEHCRTSSASSRSQWALPDFIRELQIPVGTAGLQSVYMPN
eukprot:s303_g22.t1